jgi:hypothetical protein
MYPWPIGDFDNAMDEALDIAMDYLERTGQAVKFTEVQRAAAMAIVVSSSGRTRKACLKAGKNLPTVPFLESGRPAPN